MATNSDSQPPDPKGTGYTPGNDTWSRWRNVFSLLTGSMTDEGKKQYKLATDDRHEKANCQKCERQRDYLLQYSKAKSRSLENFDGREN